MKGTDTRWKLKSQKGMKNIRSGKYMGESKTLAVFLLLISLKDN